MKLIKSILFGMAIATALCVFIFVVGAVAAHLAGVHPLAPIPWIIFMVGVVIGLIKWDSER